MCKINICFVPDHSIEQIAIKKDLSPAKASCLKRTGRAFAGVCGAVGLVGGGLGGLALYDFFCKGTVCLRENAGTWFKNGIPITASLVMGVALPVTFCLGLHIYATCCMSGRTYQPVPAMSPLPGAE